MKYLAIISLVIALIVGAYALYAIQGIWDQLGRTQDTLKALQEELETIRSTREPLAVEPNYITLYFIEITPTDFVLTQIKREISEKPSPLLALEALVKGPTTGENLEPSIPQGTKVISLTIKEGLATANFSREIHDNFVGGSQLESHLVTAIVKTLTEFADIQQVQILVEGKNIESIGGHVVIDQPLNGAW